MDGTSTARHTITSPHLGGLGGSALRGSALGGCDWATFLRFCVNGCLAVAIQYGVYLLLIHWIEVNIAYTISYIVSFIYNFIVTSYWTFHSRPSWKRLTGFGGSHVVNYFVQLGFLNLYLWLGIPKEYAAILAMGSAVPINFCMLHFVYKKK